MQTKKVAKEHCPLSQSTVSLMKLLGQSAYRTSLSCMQTGGVAQASLSTSGLTFSLPPPCGRNLRCFNASLLRQHGDENHSE
ncbi:MAG: hypothetical protein P8047_11340 [Gammaproteobacteria bacterium]